MAYVCGLPVVPGAVAISALGGRRADKTEWGNYWKEAEQLPVVVTQ